MSRRTDEEYMFDVLPQEILFPYSQGRTITHEDRREALAQFREMLEIEQAMNDPNVQLTYRQREERFLMIQQQQERKRRAQIREREREQLEREQERAERRIRECERIQCEQEEYERKKEERGLREWEKQEELKRARALQPPLHVRMVDAMVNVSLRVGMVVIKSLGS